MEETEVRKSRRIDIADQRLLLDKVARDFNQNLALKSMAIEKKSAEHENKQKTEAAEERCLNITIRSIILGFLSVQV